MSKKIKLEDKFKYKNEENIDSIFNYLATINKGLKNRHISFSNNDDMIDMHLPEQALLEVKAQHKKHDSSLRIEIHWQTSSSNADKKDKKKSKAKQAIEKETPAKKTEKAKSSSAKEIKKDKAKTKKEDSKKTASNKTKSKKEKTKNHSKPKETNTA